MNCYLLVPTLALAALSLNGCNGPSSSSPRSSISGSNYSRGYQATSSSSFRNGYAGSSLASSFGRSTSYSNPSSSTSPGLLDSLAETVCKLKPGG